MLGVRRRTDAKHVNASVLPRIGAARCRVQNAVSRQTGCEVSEHAAQEREVQLGDLANAEASEVFATERLC